MEVKSSMTVDKQSDREPVKNVKFEKQNKQFKVNEYLNTELKELNLHMKTSKSPAHKILTANSSGTAISFL